MAAIFGEGKIFENFQEYIPLIPCASKIWTKSLYLARLRRYKQFCVFPFLAKNRKFKMAAIFGEGKIFENFQEYIPLIPCASKISTKSLYLARLRRYKQFCVFPFLAKNRKFKMAAIFGEGKIFENFQEYIPLIPCASKIWTKSLYLARLRRYKQFCVFPFLAKNRKFKMAAIFGEGEIFENCREYIPEISCRSKISTKSLYLARLRRYKQFCVFPFLAENRKFKMAAIFGEGKFLKIAENTFLRYPVGRKFRQNRSISHG